MKAFYKSLFLTTHFYVSAGSVFLCAFLGYFFRLFYAISTILWPLWLLVLFAEIIYLYRSGRIFGSRFLPERLSNGDDNTIYISVRNAYPFPMNIWAVDELPIQFQKRDLNIHGFIAAGADSRLFYVLHPVKRGEYHFGSLHLFATWRWGMFSRRFTFEEPKMVKVYPSFLKVNQYIQMSDAYLMRELGIKKTRRVGHTLEFDSIRNYVIGDDHRSINWRATARTTDVMVNQYEDEKAQQIYAVIDKGRVMKMPFEGLSLLDYAINATLMLAHISIRKQDKSGLITFANKLSHFVLAENKRTHLNTILEALYNQRTLYPESNYAGIAAHVYKRIPQRSLIVFFTNFESVASLERQLPNLRLMAKKHLLLVVFFENTEIKKALITEPRDAQEVYEQIIAEQFSYDKRRMVKILQQNGIKALLSAPQSLTVNVINKYLEIKSRALI